MYLTQNITGICDSFANDLHRKLKSCENDTFFSIEVLNIINEVDQIELKLQLFSFSIIKIKYSEQSYISFTSLLLLLSHDIELNPGPNGILNTGPNQVNASAGIWHPFKKRGLHFLHLNVNSLLPKIDEIRYIATLSNAAIIGISESKLDDSVLDCEVNICGYDLLRCDRNRNGGGVACYIRQNINYNKKDIFPDSIENIVVDILLPKTKPFTVCTLYRPPVQYNFVDDINDNFDKLSPESTDIFILGDMNINILKNGVNFLKRTTCLNGSTPIETILKKYKTFCSSFSLLQIINSPTRVTSNTSSLIDHILTNANDKISNSGVIDVGLSDHQLIFCTRKLLKTKFNFHKKIKCRSFKNYNSEIFIQRLRESNFSNYSCFNDINEAYNDFSAKLLSAINKSAPLKERRIKNNNEEWFDGEILDAILTRDKVLKKFKKTKLPADELCYKQSKYFLQNLILNKKKTFFGDKLKETIGRPKELWKNLRDLGLPKTVSTTSATICLKSNDTLSFDLQKNVEIFKDFYSSLADSLLKKLPNAPLKFDKTFFSACYQKFEKNNFKFSKTSVEHVQQLLMDINPTKSAGIDNISGRFIKDGASILSLPITQICNLSIKLSSFPTRCKIAKLKPIFKKGSKTDPQNYRPISLLPLISKVIEKVIHDQTQSYLSENDILYKYQSGFRSNHSTNSCLVYLTDLISKGFDSGLYTGMILIDLQKAFDTIDHEILLEKMIYLGFSDQTIKWFRCYLSNRTFIVNISDKSSNLGKVSCGVPQGSILGPLLFLMYVNDMPHAISSKLLLYADDSCIIFQHKDIKVIEENLNKDFENLCDWFIDNKLSIHFGQDKTKSILFASKSRKRKGNHININYRDIEIKQHSSVSYLGCVLDDTLSGESMALKILRKINSRLRFLYRKDKFLTPVLRRMLCNALIQPHFDYACLAWYSNLTQAMKSKVQIMQNKCIRFCLQLRPLDHIGQHHFQRMNWLNVRDRFNQCLCSAVFNFIHNRSPQYMSEIFHIAPQINIGTRCSKLKLILPFRKTNMGQNTLSFLGPQQWNKLPNEIKLSKTINTFKHKLKEYFFDEKDKLR